MCLPLSWCYHTKCIFLITWVFIDWKRYGNDKWVIHEARTLDPEWRDPAGRAQEGNNGSRRPYRSRGGLRPSVPCPTKQDLAWRTSGRSILQRPPSFPSARTTRYWSEDSAGVPQRGDTGQKTAQRTSTATPVRKQRRGHRQRRQQKFPLATLPSPRKAHWGAQERRGRQALRWSRVNVRLR